MSVSAGQTGVPSPCETLQRSLYDRIFRQYEKHYDDPTSQHYRTEFIYEPLLSQVDLAGADVLEAMCGSGQATQYLLERRSRVTGLDLARPAIDSFRSRWPRARAICASILDSGIPDRAFDCVLVVGGLHHLHPLVVPAVEEIARVLRPGGHFCFVEPHVGSLFNIARTWWYRRDPLFAPNEAAIDLSALKASFAQRFDFLEERYLGNIAYLLVLNSFIFRIPLGWKRFYAPPLMAVERLLLPVQTKLLSCFVACKWRKKCE